MTLPSDIPEDVLRAADDVHQRLSALPLLGRQPETEIIARAIMAERAEVDRLRSALMRIAFKDRYTRNYRHDENGGFRGIGGRIAAHALTGVPGAYVTDERLAETFPEIAAAIRNGDAS